MIAQGNTETTVNHCKAMLCRIKHKYKQITDFKMPIIFDNVTLSGASLVAAASSPTPPDVAISLSSPDSGTITVSLNELNIINNISWYTYVAIPVGGGGATNEILLNADMVAGIYDASGNFSNECTPSNSLITESGLLYIGIAIGPVTWGLTNWTTTGGTVASDNTFEMVRYT
jgi:hypothetical protein